MAGSFSIEQICSAGLAMLGQNPISDIEGTNPHAVLCKSIYYVTRDGLLSQYNWRFATKRVALAYSTTVPDYEYAYQYPLPSDCFRVQATHDRTITYVIESENLLTNYDEVYIKYTRRVDESGYLDPLFVELLAARIALKLAMPILKKASAVQLMAGFAKEALSAAKHNDAIQDFPADITAEEKSLWLAAR